MIYLLPHAITEAASRTPDHEALRFAGAGLTYATLAERAAQLARFLTEGGVARGDRVGIYMNKSLESVIALYGIMLAGAAYVPLDPFAPVARLAFVIRDCGIRCLISRDDKAAALREMLDLAPGLELLVGVTPDDSWPVRVASWADVATMPASGTPTQPIEQDLAYILYTSGSTGDPKGIMHTHRSGLAFARWAADAYGLRPDDRLSNHAPLHFDLSTFDLFAGALAGATTVVIPEAVTRFPASISKLMQDERISVWYSVPFALTQMLLRGNVGARDLSNLRWLLFAGEVFPTKYLRQLMAALPHVRFSNLYGPTETNVCTYYHVDTVPADTDEPVSIGVACANAEALIVDADNRPVAPGAPGELLIRGPIVMRGYWGRPELTERGLFHRAFHPGYTEPYYHTGDLVLEMPDGNLKFLGRKDRQIKTRGYRVELDEIEVALLGHAAVQEAAVYAMPDPDGEGTNLIYAAVTAKEGATPTAEDLTEHLNSRLPWYAIPARIEIVAEFPRTSTGKIDRRALADQSNS